MAFDLGYSTEIWGTGGSEANPWFGYLRPSVTGFTAGSYNSGRAMLEIYPVSFLGIEGGAEAISNTNEYKAYDCATYNCLGKFWTTFAGATLIAGAGRVFLVAKGKVVNLRQHPAQSANFIEPTSGLVAQRQGDQLTVASGAAGLKVSQSWSVIYAYARSEMKEIESSSEMHLGILSWKSGDWRISAGGGTFRSDIKERQGTGILRIEWRATPQLGLL